LTSDGRRRRRRWVKDLAVERQGCNVRGIFEHLHRGGVPRIDLHRPGYARAQDKIHSKKPTQTASPGQSRAQILPDPMGSFSRPRWSDASAIMKRLRVEPWFSDELARR